MGHHPIGAGKVVHTRRTFRVVHGVSKIADQGDVFAHTDHLPNCEGATQHAHVEMHTAQNDMVDAALGQQVPGFLTIVGQSVSRFDPQARMLTSPRLTDGALGAVARAAHVRIVDGQHPFVRSIRPAPSGAPAFGRGQRTGRCRKARLEGQFAGRAPLIKSRHAAGCVNNENTLLSGRIQRPVHGLNEFTHAGRGRLAPVVIP